MTIAPYMGYPRNLLGSGYNCPRLQLFGYRTESALNRAIAKKAKPILTTCPANADLSKWLAVRDAELRALGVRNPSIAPNDSKRKAP